MPYIVFSTMSSFTFFYMLHGIFVNVSNKVELFRIILKILFNNQGKFLGTGCQVQANIDWWSFTLIFY